VRQGLLHGGPNTLAVRVTDDGGRKHLNLDLVSRAPLTTLPVQGFVKNHAFAPLVEMVRERMARFGVTAGQVSVFELSTADPNDRQEMVNVGIGFMEIDLSRAVTPDNAFRLASLDKAPVTSALEQMVADGLVSWDDNAWSLLQSAGVYATNGTPLPALANVTLGDLVNFGASGVKLPFVPWNDDNFYASLGVTRDTIAPADIMRWYFSTPASGSENCYNPCADVRRFIAEAIAPGGLPAYLQTHFSADIHYARGKVENRPLDAQGNQVQPWYTTFQDDSVSFRYDAVNVMASTAHDYNVYFIHRNAGFNYTWISYGAFAGTRSFLRIFRSADNSRQIYVTVLMNRSGVEFGNAPNLDGALRDALAALPSSAWSDSDCGSDGCLAADGGQIAFSATATTNARRNTRNRWVHLSAGDSLTAGTCGLPGASGTGDTFVRIANSDGQSMAHNDNACGNLSQVHFTAASDGFYRLQAGCASSSACEGVMAYQVSDEVAPPRVPHLFACRLKILSARMTNPQAIRATPSAHRR